MSAEPGWYPDPYDASLVRWFDGNAWTEHTQPNPQAQPPLQPTTYPGGNQPTAWQPEQPQPTYPAQQQESYQPQVGYQPTAWPTGQNPTGALPGYALDTRNGQWDTVSSTGKLTPPDEYKMAAVRRGNPNKKRNLIIGAGVGLVVVIIIAAGTLVGGDSSTTAPTIPTESSSTIPGADTNTYKAADSSYSFTPNTGWAESGTNRWELAQSPGVSFSIDLGAVVAGTTLTQAVATITEEAATRRGYVFVSDSGINLPNGSARLIVFEEGDVAAPPTTSAGGAFTPTTAPKPLKRSRSAVTVLVLGEQLVKVTFSAPTEKYLTEWSRAQAMVLTLRVPAGADTPQSSSTAPPTTPPPGPTTTPTVSP